MTDIVEGIVHLHKNKVGHWDIKLENTVFSDGRVKLIDMSGSGDAEKPISENHFTRVFAAPGTIISWSNIIRIFN